MSDNVANRIADLLKISAIILFIAVIPIWPYVFYTLLRFIVCICSAYVAFKLKNTVLANQKIPLIIVAILFNPLLPIYLIRLIWLPIDIGIGVYFISLRKKILVAA